jgi:hypothetical protein
VRRLLLVALMLALSACGEDNPVLTTGPSPAEEQAASEDIEVTAVEYKFHGVPTAVSEGEHTFVLQNDGGEVHELFLFHIPGEETLEELLALNEEEVSKVTQAVDRAEAKPGQTDDFTAALVPGRFGYVCCVTTEEGKPHAFLGMVGEFSVA